MKYRSIQLQWPLVQDKYINLGIFQIVYDLFSVAF